MKHKGLVSIFKSFSPDELELFGRFINAPYHRKERIFKSYFQTFKEFYPDFNSENFNDRFIYSRIHPEKEYDEKHADSLIRMLSSELTSLAEKFLFHLNVIRDPAEYKLRLVDEESRRGLFKLASKNINSAIEEMNNSNLDAGLFSTLEKFYKYKQEYEYKITDSPAYIKSIDKESENFLYYIMSKASELIQSINADLYDLNADLDSNKLLNFFRSINYDKLINSLTPNPSPRGRGTEASATPPLEITQEDKGNNRLYKMYLYLLKMLCGELDSNSFNEFQKLYKYNRKFLSRSEKYNLYLMSMSLCGKLKCRSGGNFMCACFDMHKNILKENAYKPDKNCYMSERVYRAIVLAAVMEKDIRFAEDFIQNYTIELPPDNRAAMYNFAKANINFCSGNYGEAIEYSSKISNSIMQLKYDIKCLLLKIYYEMDYTQEFNYVSGSFRQFLKNNTTVSAPKRTKYINFINCINELVKYKDQDSFKTAEILKKEIIQINEIAHKAWLTEKADELGQQKLSILAVK